ncbi:MAG: Uma2 family endonuclease, partial [Chthoniobacterales bacterium]
AEILEDDELPKISGRVETDRHGYLMVSPPAAPWHSSFQLEIGRRLADMLPDGRAMTECAISTADGVRAADVTWLSRERSGEIEENVCLASAPEICIEIVSPSNTAFEMREKRALYFAAGAHEVWFCDREGKMTFFINANSTGESTSRFCPQFPTHIKLS